MICKVFTWLDFVEEEALKSYTGSQVATWPILVAYPKRQEQSSSGLWTCSAIGDEHESSHTRGFCNSPVAVMKKLAVP
jgi:hypothetical protein